MRLIYFTNSYPYGHGELWKTNELAVLKELFDEIILQPFSYGGNTKPVAPIEGVKYNKPLFEDGIGLPIGWRKISSVIFSKHIFTAVAEALSEKVFSSKAKFMKWLNATAKAIVITKNKQFRLLIDSADKNTTLYFYWGREASEALPFIHTGARKIVTRFHRYDLYREFNNNYIPYQGKQIAAMDFALPCSQDGKNKLDSYYPSLAEKIIVQRLGTVSKGRAVAADNGVLHIVSCSFVEKVKRVAIIAEALKHVSVKVKWTHIGTGSLLTNVQNISGQVPSNVEVNFVGKLSNEEVIEYYTRQPVDLFINVSESEGVPVSIMEAFAAGIPVMATDAGGTKEIVDEQVGLLLPNHIEAKQLAKHIDAFASLPTEKKNALRDRAYQRYEEMCNAKKLSNAFGNWLLS